MAWYYRLNSDTKSISRERVDDDLVILPTYTFFI